MSAKQKKHEPVAASFEEVLKAIARSKYKDKEKIENKRRKRKKKQ